MTPKVDSLEKTSRTEDDGTWKSVFHLSFHQHELFGYHICRVEIRMAKVTVESDVIMIADTD
jgi:hypothetical protein